MNLKIEVKPSFGRLSKVIGDIKLGTAIQEGIERLAFGIEGESKKVSPVDTGRMRGSIRTDMRTLEAIIAPHTEYAIYVHEGTWKMRGRPFMVWGLESARNRMLGTRDPVLEEIVKQISAQLRVL